MVSWDAKDQWIVTACSDYSLKVWDSFTGALIQILNGHKDEVFVLEGHPLESQVTRSFVLVFLYILLFLNFYITITRDHGENML